LLGTAPPTVAGGRLAAEWLAGSDERPTAVFAFDDAQAVGAMLALQDRGVAVPDAMSVAGFDDIERASLVRPGLTTMAQPIEEIGRLGAEMLIGRIREGASGRTLLLPPRLVVRGSTAPPQRASSRGRKSVTSGT